MDELSKWMLTFKGKLDENTSSKVFQILQANGFTSRLQLKIDVMFQNEISLGAKSLLLYKVDVLCDESPLQINQKTTFKRNEVEDTQPQARKVSAHAHFICND